MSASNPIDLNDLLPLPAVVLGRYRHYKGGEYDVIGVARHSESCSPMVVYRPVRAHSGWWVRDATMFFEQVWVDGILRPRFELIQIAEPASAT